MEKEQIEQITYQKIYILERWITFEEFKGEYGLMTCFHSSETTNEDTGLVIAKAFFELTGNDLILIHKKVFWISEKDFLENFKED